MSDTMKEVNKILSEISRRYSEQLFRKWQRKTLRGCFLPHSLWVLILSRTVTVTVSVISPERQLCHALRPVILTNKTGYLASVVSADTGCGTGDSPWLITLLPGQRINITLYDFTTQPDAAHALGSNSTSAGSDVTGSGSADSQTRLCRVYATVRETNGARAVTICGGQLRQRPAYVTLGHVAEIRLSTATTSIGDVTVTSHVTFLLKYEGLQSLVVLPVGHVMLQELDNF